MIGGVVGGVASWFGTEQAIEVKVLGQSVGGRVATIGPLGDPQFPGSCSTAPCCTSRRSSARAHAERDPLKVEPEEGKQGASRLLDRTTQDRIGAAVARIRDAGGPVAGEDVDALATMLAPLLEQATEAAR